MSLPNEVKSPLSANVREYRHGPEMAESHTSNQLNEPIRIDEEAVRRVYPNVVKDGTKKNCFFDNSIWRFLKSFLTHLPALAATIVVLWINAKQLFWFEENLDINLQIKGLPAVQGKIGATTILNLLQLAAKIHEILIILSLSAMFLDIFLRHIVGGGVPLGMATAGYRVGDLGFLTSKMFWRSIFAQVGSPKLLALILGFLTIFSTIVGPSSAILLIPNLGFFDLPNAFSKVQMPLYYNANRTSVWPQHIGAGQLDPACQYETALYQDYCPAGWLSDVLAWAQGFQFVGLANNISVTEQTTNVIRTVEMNETNSGVTCLTTVSGTSIVSIGHLLLYIAQTDVGSISSQSRYKLTTTTMSEASGNAQNYQPLVQSQCALFDRDDLKANKTQAYFDTGAFNCYGSPDCERWQRSTWPVDDSVWNDTSPNYDSSIYYDIVLNDTIVLYYGRVPYVDSSETTQKSWVYGCSMVAHWAPSTLMIDPQQSNTMNSNISAPNSKNDWSDLGVRGEDVIQMDNDWYQWVNPPFNITTVINGNATFNSSSLPLEGVVGLFIRHRVDSTLSWMDLGSGSDGSTDINETSVAKILQRIFGVVHLEALARLNVDQLPFIITESNSTSFEYTELGLQVGNGYRNSGIWAPANSPNPDSAPALDSLSGFASPMKSTMTFGEEKNFWHMMTSWDFIPQRWGYGSGQDSPTLRFGQVIMYIYLAIFVMYTAYVLMDICIRQMSARRHHTPRKGTSNLNDLQEFLLVALRSPEWQNFTEESDKKIWKKHVCIREDDERVARLHLRQEAGGLPLDRGSSEDIELDQRSRPR